MSQPKMVSGATAEKVLQWLGWADEDYLAARALLIGGYLIQGTILANTAIEKYLKAALTNRGGHVAKSHDVSALFQDLQKTGKTLTLNKEFLDTLGKAYQLRYPDKLPVGFNIGLATVKVLVETDCSVHTIRSGFQFGRTSGLPVTTKLQQYAKMNHPGLLTDNCAFGSTDRAELFKRSTRCYELRVMDTRIMEIHYQAGPIADDGRFDLEAMKPHFSSDRSKITCTLQHTPTQAQTPESPFQKS